MSNDLISRKVLMEEIDSLHINITGLRAGKGVLQKCMEEYKKSVLKCIEEAPTAYDLDAVCMQLEEKKSEILNAIYAKVYDMYINENVSQDVKRLREKLKAFHETIDIVRNGGKK